MMAAGASGYIIKDDVPVILVDAVRGVIHGNEDWVGVPLGNQTSPPRFPTRSTLSRRELQVLQTYATGNSDEEIARHLEMSSEVLEEFFRLLKRKFRVENRDELLDAARREGIL